MLLGEEGLPLVVIERRNEVVNIVRSILLLSMRLGVIELLPKVTIPFRFESCTIELGVPIAHERLRIVPRLGDRTDSTAWMVLF